MRKDDARQLDHKTLEELRIRSIKRGHAGESPEAISKALGPNRSTIYTWLALYRDGGWSALKSRPTPDAKPRIDGKKMVDGNLSKDKESLQDRESGYIF
ncbi:MAG: helix-turn-helix domain-containing protein [Deltaproteobacteria bacterium]|nr:helix-turn-helix domain-containing protein [Deltaproteobacteria bacterium]